MSKDTDLIKGLPKVELHCHLLGVISPTFLKAIQATGQPVLVSPEDLATVYPVQGLIGFKRWLDQLLPYQAAPLSVIKPILEMHIRQLQAQRVVYTELMISPTILPKTINESIRAFADFRNWLLEIENGEIQVEFLMVIPRTLAQEKIESDVQHFIQLHKEGFIVGVALVGIETNDSIHRFGKAFGMLKEAGLGIEIHAGEHSNAETVWDALRIGHADRIGHGIGAFQDEQLVDYLYQKKIHIEFCPTSNLKTGSVSLLNTHPIQHAKLLGMNYSVSTDDPGTFECTLESEYQLLTNQMQFQMNDFQTIYRNSLSSRFQSQLRYLSSSNIEVCDTVL